MEKIMQVQKYNGYKSPNFGDRQVIKIKDGSILKGVMLEVVPNTQIYFKHLLNLGGEEFSTCLVATGDERDAINGIIKLMNVKAIKEFWELARMVNNLEDTIVSNAGEPKIISRWEDLLELPIFKDVTDKIRAVFQKS